MPEKIFEKSQKPINTGTLRFLVYSTIATHKQPITISEIQEIVNSQGYQIATQTIHNFINEALAAANISPIILQSITIHAGAKSRARAFYFTPKNKLKNNE